MSQSKSRTTQQVGFSPESLEALSFELLTQLNQLNPIQRDQLIQSALLTLNQPGAEGAPSPIPRGSFAAAAGTAPIAQRAVNTLGLDPQVLGPIIEALRGGEQRIGTQRRQQAGQIVSGVGSFIDPRFANQFAPTVTQKTTNTPSTLEVAGQIGSLVGTGAGLVALT